MHLRAEIAGKRGCLVQFGGSASMGCGIAVDLVCFSRVSYGFRDPLAHVGVLADNYRLL